MCVRCSKGFIPRDKALIQGVVSRADQDPGQGVGYKTVSIRGGASVDAVTSSKGFYSALVPTGKTYTISMADKNACVRGVVPCKPSVTAVVYDMRRVDFLLEPQPPLFCRLEMGEHTDSVVRLRLTVVNRGKEVLRGLKVAPLEVVSARRVRGGAGRGRHGTSAGMPAHTATPRSPTASCACRPALPWRSQLRRGRCQSRLRSWRRARRL